MAIPRNLILNLIGPHRRGLLAVMAVMLIESVVTLAIPYVGGLLAGVFLDPSAPGPGAGVLVVGLIGLLAALGLLHMGSTYLYARVSEGLLADLRVRLFDHIQRLPLSWHQARRSGDVLALLTQEVSSLAHFVTGTLIGIPPLLLTAAGASVIMLTIDPALALLVPVLVPAFYLTWKLILRRMRGLARQIQAEHAAAVAMAEETLALLPAVKSFTQEGAERRAYAAQIDRVRALSLRQAGIYAVLDPLLKFVVAVAAVVLLVLAGQSLQAGALSPGALVSMLMYVAVLVRPVAALAGVYGAIQTARGTLDRMQEVLAEPAEAVDPPPAPAPAWRGEIVFDGVSFAYPGRLAAVEGLKLHIRPGETVALTGENGAGKSTAIALLLGFFRPDAGRILLDGRDIAALPLAHLRAAIGLVPQTRYLRDGSVRDNIAFGNEAATQELVEAAARLAQAHEFIAALPQGYDTLIGDKGVRLSGGQQQRVALARALLKDPPILILDEATSMYDLEGEAAFVAECRTALAGRTVILITHRPASLALADRVLRMDAGRIVAEDVRA